MKTASIPSLRVTPELRRAAESVLEEGESLSSFVEHSLKLCIDKRRLQSEFIARGLASREAAQHNGEYFSASDVHAELDRMLNDAVVKAPTGQ